MNINHSESETILIVDDNESSLKLLTDLVEASGYSVLQAQYGEMALLIAQSKRPDLILLDIRMTGMDGYEVCRRLKLDSVTSGTPIIFLSALDDIEAKLKGFKSGASDYISKPYQADEVLARIKTQLELTSFRNKLEEMVKDRTKQLEAEILERKQATHDLMESRQKLQELSWHMENVREDERKRIARELHDELGQVLTTQRIALEELASKFTHMDESQIQEKLKDIVLNLDQVADTARAISENLRPGVLDLLGLSAAFEQHLNKFMTSTKLKCKLEMSQEEFNVSPNVATVMFRILQESLTNIARHAHANTVEVRLAELNDELILIVEDDGEGIQEIPSGTRKGFGIMGMKERINLLGGNFILESDPHRGTRIEANIPLYVNEGE